MEEAVAMVAYGYLFHAVTVVAAVEQEYIVAASQFPDPSHSGADLVDTYLSLTSSLVCMY